MSIWPVVMCPGCQVPMGVKAVIEDRPGTDSVTVIYECPICKTETQRHQKAVGREARDDRDPRDS